MSNLGKQTNEGITYYLDDTARALTERINLADVADLGWTGEYNEEAVLAPFIYAAQRTGTLYGFTEEDYHRVADFFASNPTPRVATKAKWARQVVSEVTLDSLADKGYLRVESDGEAKVYFPSERLVAGAIRR